MEAVTMSFESAIRRVQQKIEYCETRIADPTTSARTKHYTELDRAAFLMAVQALRYASEMQEWEKAQVAAKEER